MCWEGRGEVGRKGEVCVEREGGRCVLRGKGKVCVREGGGWTCIM